MTSGPSLPELVGIGDDNRVLARADLENELNLRALVDRLELGAVMLFGRLVGYGLSMDLPVTVQVGIAVPWSCFWTASTGSLRRGSSTSD
jgi:hypothetical protein